VLRTLGDGTLHFQYITPDGTSRHIWNTPLRAWQAFVIGFRVSRDSDGWTQLWHNGARQTFTNGATQFDGPTLMGREVKAKRGRLSLGPGQRQRDSLAEPATPGHHTRRRAPPAS
jgi:hypothetical protein